MDERKNTISEILDLLEEADLDTIIAIRDFVADIV